MTKRPRRNHSQAFKAKVAVAAVKREKTLNEVAQNFDVHPTQTKRWHEQLLKGATGVFGQTTKPVPGPVIDVKTLHAKIAAVPDENDFCPTLLGQGGSVGERKKMIDLMAKLSVSRQATILGISRGLLG